MASKKSLAAAAALVDASITEEAFVAESPPVNDYPPAHVDTPTALAEETTAPVGTPVATAPALALIPRYFAKAFETPVKSMPQMQEKVREMIDKTLAESRANYAKVKSAADETNTALEASFATAKSGVAEINAKALELLRATADANFEFLKSVFSAKTIADYVALHGEFARKQFESMTSQTRELTELARKVANDAAEPIKTQVAKTIKVAA